MRYRSVIVLVLVLIVLTHVIPAATPSVGLVPHDGLQAEIHTAVVGLTGAGTEEQRQVAVAAASDLGRRDDIDRTQLLEQVAIFLAGAGGTEDTMGGALLFHVLEFQRDEVLAATLPHLVEAAPEQNKILREFAASTVVAGCSDPVSVVLEIEELRTDRPHGGTVFGSSGQATRRGAMADLLLELAGSDDPWVRAYGAAVISADPELVSSEVRSRFGVE
jgi:hypothetical protein